MRQDHPTAFQRYRSCCAAAAAGLLLTATPAAAAWEHPHGDSTNAHFADVATAPAGAGSTSVPGLGTFAPGAGPVIAPDGTVYLGTLEGKVIALRADGSPYWTREVGPGERIVASPVIGADGSVYVVGVAGPMKIRDHRGGQTTTTTVGKATLHKFTASGGKPGGGTPFPENRQAGRPDAYGPVSTGAPNIVRFGGKEEFVVVTAVYPAVGGPDLHLLVFSALGGLAADAVVAYWGGSDVEEAGGLLAYLFPGFTHGSFGPPGPPPLPGAAVFNYGAGAAPWVVVVDPYKDEVVGFTFIPGQGLAEAFRRRAAPAALQSAPTILPDLHSVVATNDGAVFAGPNQAALPPVVGQGASYAAPTRTVDGLVVLVTVDSGVRVLRQGAAVSRTGFTGRSIVSAAASRTHVFVSTTNALFTYDAAAQAELKKFPWLGGGISPPAIGPDGRVYAIASNILFIFPPPKPGVGVGRVGQVATVGPVLGTKPEIAPGPDPALTPPPAGPKRYKDPKGPTGLRLYACTAVGGSTCERPVALAFCQGQGYARAGKYDTDNKKIKAETLAGEVCTKKRCRVFEYIDCLN